MSAHQLEATLAEIKANPTRVFKAKLVRQALGISETKMTQCLHQLYPNRKRTNRQWSMDKRVLRARTGVVRALKGCGYSFKEIAMVLHTTPEPVRRIFYKAFRA